MIIAIGSFQREANRIIRSRNYLPIDSPEEFLAFESKSSEIPVIILSGSGAPRASHATKWAIENFSPEGIISFGVCAATKELIRSGDIVIASDVIELEGPPLEWSMEIEKDALEPDRKMLLASRAAVEISGLDYHQGTIATIPQIVTGESIKHWLGQTINSTAIDTESYAIASISHQSKIPWLAISAVVDDVHFNTPSTARRIGIGPNERGVKTYLRHVTNTPRDLLAIIQFNRYKNRADASLETFMLSFNEAIRVATKL
tara:strand:+ start:5546 stop:6325 length:780 start_codon:yes stop_codon:yes gene_type:complete